MGKQTKCRDCNKTLDFWQGVLCGNGTYDLCDECYEHHTPQVELDQSVSDEPID